MRLLPIPYRHAPKTIWYGPTMKNNLPRKSTNKPPPLTWNETNYCGTPYQNIIIAGPNLTQGK